MTEQSTALAVSNGEHPKPSLVKAPLMAGAIPRAIVPVDFDGAYRIANVVVQAGMAPKTLGSVEKAMVAILHGLEVGLTPMNALQSIAVINGRPTIWGDGAIGLIRASGLMEYMQEYFEGEGTKLTAVCIVKRKGEPKPVRGEFSWSDVLRARLNSKEGPWQTYPRRMMQMRARWPLRDVFADVLKGLALKEEVEDMDRQEVQHEPEQQQQPPQTARRAPPPPGHVAKEAEKPTEAERPSDGFPGDEPAPKQKHDPISSGLGQQQGDGTFPGDKPMATRQQPETDNEIPLALDRQLTDDDRDWLIILGENLDQCETPEDVQSTVDSIMMPATDTAKPHAWNRAVALQRRHAARVQEQR